MKKLLVVVIVLATVAGNSVATPLIGRSGALSKPFQAFAWANFGYNQTASSYSWDSTKYLTPAGFVSTKTTSCDVTVGLGLPFKLERQAQPDRDVTGRGLGRHEAGRRQILG